VRCNSWHPLQMLLHCMPFQKAGQGASSSNLGRTQFTCCRCRGFADENVPHGGGGRQRAGEGGGHQDRVGRWQEPHRQGALLQDSLNRGKKGACLDSLHPPASFRLIRHQITNNHHVLGDEIHLPYVVVLYNYAAPAQLRQGRGIQHCSNLRCSLEGQHGAVAVGKNTHLYARFLSSQPCASCFAPRQVMRKKPKKLLCSQR